MILKPANQGLYETRREHDACGIGAVVNINGVRDHSIIDYGKEILINLHHLLAAHLHLGAPPRGEEPNIAISREYAADNGKAALPRLLILPVRAARCGAGRARAGMGVEQPAALHPELLHQGEGVEHISGAGERAGKAPPDTTQRDQISEDEAFLQLETRDQSHVLAAATG